MSDNQPVMTCANHPTVETLLCCNQCEKPICIKCAVRTPTGYRCRECVRGREKVFDTAQKLDYLWAFIVPAVLGGIGAVFIPDLGLFTFLLAPILGAAIAEIVRRLIAKRRSNKLFLTAVVGVLAGSLPAFSTLLLSGIYELAMGGGLWGLYPLLWTAIYVALTASTVYYSLSGITIRT